jgi:glycosyl transferase family 25
MKTFVINLERDKKRRIHMEELLHRINVQYEFFPGIYGRGLSDSERTRDYDEKKVMRTQCRALVPAEIGCALSHIAVYRRMIEHHIPAVLVLEDDVIATDNLKLVLSALENHPSMKMPSVVLLSPAEGDMKKADTLVEGYTIAPFRSGFFNHSYVVTLAGAFALLKALYPVGDVADCWRRQGKHKVVDLYVVSPPCVVQNQAEFGGSTGSELMALVPKRRGVNKLWFKARRAFWLTFDSFVALYDRHLNPYCGTVKKQ